MSEQSATEHDKAIESLREVAAALKRLREMLAEERQEHASTRDELWALKAVLSEAQAEAEEGREGLEALAAVDDYRLGLCDKDELLQRVCGRT